MSSQNKLIRKITTATIAFKLESR